MRNTVVVTHPGRQHSHRAALALEGAGRLAGYWAGVPVLERDRGIVPRWLWRRFVRYAPVELPPERSRAVPWIPAIRRIGDRLPRRIASRIDFVACRSFDNWVARRIGSASGPAGAVLACEISALSTFQRAAELGWVKLLDAPSIHHREQDRLHVIAETPAVGRRVRWVKDQEIATADAIVTVSELARQTYLAAGVPETKVIAVPLGADLELFGRERTTRSDGPCRFLFAGAPIPRKGFDLLIAALERLAGEEIPFHLRLVGPRGEQSRLLGRLAPSLWSSAGSVTQESLAQELAASDCLVLPSRNDSFGMVVAEGLAAGVPAIVSTMVGAAELLTEGVCGWVVPVDDVAALTSRLRRCALWPEIPRRMRDACRERALDSTWRAYEARFVAALAPILDRKPS
jgi:glycosyltransferase involved in cell wall biosynthesis